MDAWDELLRQSLLGTGRASEALPALPTPLGELLAQADLAPEQRLLHAAILLDRYRRLGSLPAPAPADLPVAPAEHLALCSATLAGLLRGLLDDDDPVLLMELLQGMAALPCRAPPDTLPALLDLALSRSELLAPLLSCGGERLRWLAAQHREWSGLLGEVGDDPWLTGNTASRVAFLQAERRRDPDAARERLAAGFAQEAARERLAFLDCLVEGLAAADIPFLASCLADRSQPLRLQASRLLVRLGDNPTAIQVRDTVAGMVSLARKVVRQHLKIDLPESFDKDWGRLGLREKPPAGERIGPRAFWLSQWLGLLGPGRLVALLEVDLEQLAALIKRSDFARELKATLEDSAVVLADGDYAEWRLNRAGPEDFVVQFPQLGGALPAERRDALLGEFLQAYLARLEPDTLLGLMVAVDSLSPTNTGVVVAQFPTLCAALVKHPWQGQRLAQLAYHLAPTEAAALEPHCLAHGTLPGVNEFWRRYERRCRIHQALAA